MVVDIASTRKTISITEALLEMGVNKTHIQYVTERVKSTKEPLDKAAMDMGLISPELVARAISNVSNFHYFSPTDVEFIDKDEMMGFLLNKDSSFNIGKYNGYIPVGIKDNQLLIAVSSVEQINEARNTFFDYSTNIVIASPQTIQKVYRMFFSDTKSSFFEALRNFTKSSDEEDRQKVLEDFYCNLLKHGCYYGASDIKMWRSSSAGMISLKKEGRGELLCSISTEEYNSILELLKMKTSNSDKLKQEPKESKIDRTFVSDSAYKNYADIFDRYVFRVQLYMAPDTEWISTVIRINDSQSQVTDFSSLDFDEPSKALLRRWINSPTGMLLVTGPTGSGKTSVLYSLLREVDPISRSIFTVENPIEYRNGMWVQKLMEKSLGRDESEMARLMLNSLLREAPDVILFGEVRRDKELLDNVMDASNTGHLVLSTLHTNRAALTVLRLLDIGADPKTVASCLMGILAVRLIGILCPHCKEPDVRQQSVKAMDSISSYDSNTVIYRAVGCPHCNGQGYRGRKMVYEILNCGRVQDLIEQGAKSIKDIEQRGLVGLSMWNRALMLVAKGETSVDEVEKRIFNPELGV
jgi:type II secretory ATPase GspE/PulE/Tfp pilus assembly ATPase PilB-like protein